MPGTAAILSRLARLSSPPIHLSNPTSPLPFDDDPQSDSSTDWRVVGISFFSFVVLGIQGALLNVAWSSMRATFRQPLDAVGFLFMASTSGYFAASSISGRWMVRLGLARLLTISTLAGAVGLLAQSLAPTWPALLLCSLLVGAGTGLLDGGMNIFFAARFGPQLMNWLHASFGVGATMSQLVMTGLLKSGHSWRWGYDFAALLFGLTTVLFLRTGVRWRVTATGDRRPAAAVAAARETLRLPVVWLGIGLFMAYTGLEVSAGQWSFSLYTIARHVPFDVAGWWVSLYWGSFTVGRIFFGTILAWVRPDVVIRRCLIGMALSLVWLAWKPSGGAGFLPLALLGFSLSPIFALMITGTQDRLGSFHAPNAIGFQVGAAALGVGLLPGLAGRVATRWGLEAIPWFLLAVSGLMLLLFECMRDRTAMPGLKRKRP
jgi:fucose permease